MTLDIGYCRIYIISSCFSFQSQSLRMLLRRGIYGYFHFNSWLESPPMFDLFYPLARTNFFFFGGGWCLENPLLMEVVHISKNDTMKEVERTMWQNIFFQVEGSFRMKNKAYFDSWWSKHCIYFTFPESLVKFL